MSYQPNGPYVLGSGKRKGQALEVLMFQDYGWLRWMYCFLKKKFSYKKNNFHQHLEWLLNQGESRAPIMPCPHCGKREVQFFSVLYSKNGNDFSVGMRYTCCDSNECISRVRRMAIEKNPVFLPFKFSSLSQFSLKADKRRIIVLFKKAFDLPNKVDRQTAFQFFND